MKAGDTGSISFPCATCGARVSAPADAAGKRGRCRRCGASQRIPADTSTYALVDSPPVADFAAAASSVRDDARPALAHRTSRDFWSRLFHASARQTSSLEAESAALIFLSLADLMVTYHLLKTGPKFYESNPVAQFFFVRWNIAGMAIFKFSVVGFVVVAGEIVERHRPGLGRFVVLIGCLASCAVVCYGLSLAFGELAIE